ncbi:MAG: response regulator, partial [Nevskiales bacterium]
MRPGSKTASEGAAGPPRRSVEVLVVDDSAVVRQVMTALLSEERRVNVTVAADPIFAMDKMRKTRPDVIVLDLEMPRMDGLSFLKKLMAERPLPVVVCSAVAPRGTEQALRALEHGAVDIVGKPRLGVRDFLYESAVMLGDTIRAAGAARLRLRNGQTSPGWPSPRAAADDKGLAGPPVPSDSIIAI